MRSWPDCLTPPPARLHTLLLPLAAFLLFAAGAVVCDPPHPQRSNLLTGCPGAQYLDCGSATCCTAFCIRALRLFIITVLLPLPLLSGLLLASLASLLYLPVGTSLLLLRHSPLASAALSSSRLHHQRAIDVAFPLRKRLMSGRYLSSRLLNLALLGISPVILLAAIVIQVRHTPWSTRCLNQPYPSLIYIYIYNDLIN